MRFRKTTNRAPFFNAAHQRRLLFLVGLLVFVLLAMRVAANPGTWSWLFVSEETTQNDETTKDVAKTSADNDDRTSSQSKLKPKEFRSPAKDSEFSPDSDKPSTTPDAKRRAVDAAVAETCGQTGIALNPHLFETVEDRELGATYNELPAYHAILRHVAGVNQNALARNAQQVAYTVLMHNPDHFRGNVITIEGRLGSLKRLPASEVEGSLKELYEAWIVTPGSGKDPYRVVVSELPAGLEPQDMYDRPPEVWVTGYFFKIQKYEVEQREDIPRYHYAPLLLAKRLERVDREGTAVNGRGLAPYVVGFALLMGGLLIVTLWRFSNGDKKFAETHLKRFDATQKEDVSELNGLEPSPNTEEFFRQLSESPPPETDMTTPDEKTSP